MMLKAVMDALAIQVAHVEVCGFGVGEKGNGRCFIRHSRSSINNPGKKMKHHKLPFIAIGWGTIVIFQDLDGNVLKLMQV